MLTAGARDVLRVYVSACASWLNVKWVRTETRMGEWNIYFALKPVTEVVYHRWLWYHRAFSFPQKSKHLLWFSFPNLLKCILSCLGGHIDKDCDFIFQRKPVCRSEERWEKFAISWITGERYWSVLFNLISSSGLSAHNIAPLACLKLHQLIHFSQYN